VRDAAHFETLLSRRFDEGGPVLLAAKIDDTSGTAQAAAYRATGIASCCRITIACEDISERGNYDPHPQPLPIRGRGADRLRGKIVRIPRAHLIVTSSLVVR
jgi:hypothetical protein